MAGLKSFLYGVAPILGVTGAILYERQRALVNLGVLTTIPGRGPGSGVPLTAENVAAVIISVLAAGSLSDVDERVAALCKAQPEDTHLIGEHRKHWIAAGKPTFRSEVARILSGQHTQFQQHSHAHTYRGIRVSRCWRGQIMRGVGRGPRPVDFFVDERDRYVSNRQISVTAEIEDEMLYKLISFTQGALSQAVEADGDDE